MKTAKLGDLVNITIGRTPSRGNTDFWDTKKQQKNVWLSIYDLQKTDGKFVNDSKEYITDEAAKAFPSVPKGTLLVSFKLTLGRLAYAGCDLRTNEAIAALHNDEVCITNEYLYYYLSYFDWMDYASSDKKVKGFTLNKSKLHEIIVVYPDSIDEQRKLVARLDAAFERIDRAIGLSKQNIKMVDTFKKSYLTQTFIDKRRIKAVKIGDICKFKPAKSLAKTRLKHNDFVSFSPMEQLPLGKKYFTPNQTKRLGEAYSSYVYFEENNVIYAKITPCFENGKLSIARNLTNGVGFGSSEFVPIRCSDKIIPEYLYYFLLQPSFITHGSQNMRGASGHKRVPDIFTERLDIHLPDINTQKHLVKKLDEAFDSMEKLQAGLNSKLERLILFKQSMLEQAFLRDGVK